VTGGTDIAEAIAARFRAEGATVVIPGGTAGRDIGDASILITVARDGDHLRAATDATRAALPALRKAGGAIVHVALPMGREMDLGLAAYAGATAGLRGFTRASAVELGHAGIRVNMVQPGVLNGSVSEAALGLLPLHRGGDAERRMGEIDDVVNAVLFLASDEAGYIHGAEFVVDGGLGQCRNAAAGRAWDSGTDIWAQ
jgi:NAD(P)-dependent dehydrogenase (short-subunit alcohol dehydrogenase family)